MEKQYVTFLFHEKKIFYDYMLTTWETGTSKEGINWRKGYWHINNRIAKPPRKGFKKVPFVVPTEDGKNTFLFFQNGFGAVINLYGDKFYTTSPAPNVTLSSNSIIEINFDVWQHAFPPTGKEEMARKAIYRPEAKPLIALFST